MKVRNVSDHPRHVAAVQTVVDPGDTLEVDKELGESLLEQTDVWGKPTRSKSSDNEEND